MKKLLLCLILCSSPLFTTSQEKCKENPLLSNSATIIKSDGDDWVNETIVSAREDFENAYKIIIEDQDIPILCPETFKDLRLLYSLSINQSRIQKIEPKAFDNLPRIRNLMITYNPLTTISSGVFEGMVVRKLTLSNNRIHTIEKNAFYSMVNLEVLDLSYNALGVFNSDWFNYLPKLYRLNFNFNAINSLPSNAFGKIIKEKHVKDDLELWFMDNSISTLDPHLFEDTMKLSDLYLSNNQITVIPPLAFARVEIETLLLDSNRLRCLPKDTLQNLHVQEFDIDDNKFDCDCLETVRAWAVENKVRLQTLRIRLACMYSKIEKLLDLRVDESSK